MHPKYSATQIRPGYYAVRPWGCLGTCGWNQGQPWTVEFVHAPSASAAITKAYPHD